MLLDRCHHFPRRRLFVLGHRLLANERRSNKARSHQQRQAPSLPAFPKLLHETVLPLNIPLCIFRAMTQIHKPYPPFGGA
jgi:hypothetical protein